MDHLKVRCNLCGLIEQISVPIQFIEWLVLENHLAMHGEVIPAHFESLRGEDFNADFEIELLLRIFELEDDREE